MKRLTGVVKSQKERIFCRVFLCFTPIILTCIFPALGITLGSILPDSCTILWDNTLRVSYDSVLSVVPQVIANGDTVNLIWFGDPTFGGNPSNGGILYCHSFDGGQVFTPQVQLLNYLQSSGNHGSLAISGRYLYVLYVNRKDSPIVYSLAVLRSTNAGLSWQLPILLGDYSPGAIAARDSNVYVYCSYVENNLARGAIMVSHDYGISWNIINNSIPPRVSNAELMATSNELHIVRDKGIQGGSQEVLYMRSSDLGLTWTSSETLSVND